MNYNESIYHSLLPLIISLEAVGALFTFFALTWSRRTLSQETLSRLHTSFIGVFLIEFWSWLIRPVLLLCKALKITPNKITAISIFLSFVTGCIYAAGHIALGGWMLVISGSLDMIDGRVARETGNVTKAGAFFDSCSDRYSDSFVFIGIAVFFLSKNFSLSSSGFSISRTDYISIIIIMTILMGSSAMSYVKARGEAVGATTKRGLMQRPERITMLSIFSVLNPFAVIILHSRKLNPDLVLIIALAVMSILINISAVVRMASLFKTIRNLEA